MSALRLFAACVLFVSLVSAASVSFNRDIRPILSDACFACHGPDKNMRMAGLRLDLREEAVKPNRRGVAPIVPGDPERSAMVQRIFATDARRIMPPPHAHKELTATQKETIRRWVAEGAPYEGHWAYEPVRRPAAPPDAPHPVDAFVRARLAKEGLRPSPEADRRTLIRRVTLDLTGLPPTPAEIEAFVADPHPDAYARLVDRLLASPRYAEKQTMHWLDAVRYADTCGFHGDNAFPAWPYRDYVLRAFHTNKPFDEFTREQLAGDLLPGATVEQRVASAYNRLTRTSAEGGIQPKEYLAKYAADRVRTASSVWLGSTVGCAECHDHKFDPFTSRDFYAMKAFFADIKETGLVPDRGPDAWGSLLALPNEEQQRRQQELSLRLAEARKRLDHAAAARAERQTAWEREVIRRYEAGELNWRYLRPFRAVAARGALLRIFNEEPVDSTYEVGGSLVSSRQPGDGLILAEGLNPDNETYTVSAKPGAGVWTALGLEVISDESLPGVRVARGADRLVVTEVEAEVSVKGKPARNLRFVLADSNLSFPAKEHPAMAAIDGDPRSGWGLTTYGNTGTPFLALRFAEPVETRADSVLTVRIRHDSEYRKATIGRFRLALSQARYAWPEPQPRPKQGADAGKSRNWGLPDAVRKLLETPPDRRTAEQEAEIRNHFAWSEPELQPLVAETRRLEAEWDLLEASIPRVVVTESTTPAETRVLPRGNWMDDSGDVVEPAIPAFLGKLSVKGRPTRLDLANWLVSPDNPLTARVFVNRMWRQFFGIGLSKVLDDLGSQGEWPTHPELLDWLAAEFIEPQFQASGAHPWDVKHLIRTIVTSETYRQSSRAAPELEQRDPDNRLLARQSRFRVEAEIVRDVALAASGLLTESFGGPSARPYQPAGYLAALNFPKREYSASRGPELYRRGVYTFWQRTFLHPSLAAFDAPSREECTVNRVHSNTPLQALVLLNDPIYVEAARALAQNMLSQGGRTVQERIAWAFRRAAGRAPTAAEAAPLLDLYGKSLQRFRREPAAARQLLSVGESPAPVRANPAQTAALTMVARAILNLHETITRN